MGVAMIVANGPLDGPPVESDAEILAKYSDSLSRRDRVQFGSTEDITGFQMADRIADRAMGQFEGGELDPDWEWGVACYAKDIRIAILAEYKGSGIEPPPAIVVNRIAQEAAENRLREVRGW